MHLKSSPKDKKSKTLSLSLCLQYIMSECSHKGHDWFDRFIVKIQ